VHFKTTCDLHLMLVFIFAKTCSHANSRDAACISSKSLSSPAQHIQFVAVQWIENSTSTTDTPACTALNKGQIGIQDLRLKTPSRTESSIVVFCVSTHSQGLREILPGGTKKSKNDTGPVAPGAAVKSCVACLYSNQNIDKTATLLRFINRFNCFTGNCLALVILGLITE